MTDFLPIYTDSYSEPKREQALGIWRLNQETMVQLYVSKPIIQLDGRTMRTALSDVYQLIEEDIDLREYEIGVGQYYPRMAIGRMQEGFNAATEYCDVWPVDTDARSMALAQYHLLHSRLEAILRVVQPNEENLNSFGHEIRDLLILACTAVEGQFKGILRANEYAFALNNRGEIRASTNDYVKTLAPMKLDSYEFVLTIEPSAPSFTPFGNWDCGAPTESLDWYTAYNAVKHDWEAEFSRATLSHAISAVTACRALHEAQFLQASEVMNHGTLFAGVAKPTWSHHEKYWPPIDGKWQPRRFSFS